MKKIDLNTSKKGFTLDRATLNKIFTKQTFTLITVVGLLLMVILYVFVYQDYQEKTEVIERSNKELDGLLTELEHYYTNIPKYEKDIEDIKTAFVEIMDEYPADAREEDVLMLGVELQKKNEIEYTSIDMKEQEGVYTVPQNLIVMAELEGYESDIVFTQKYATYANVTNYDNLKTCIETIYDSPNRIAIDEIVYVKNEEGLLEGSLSLFFYSAKGTDKEYAAPDMKEYINGTSDLFKSDKVVNNYELVEEDEPAEEAAEAEPEEEESEE